ncbi:DUF499 domain-containing protein [Methanobacterium alkalithermotolerans]|uniref:DUF499 domain-containing protein n=1 Tax=Methanobacterium alkalithermotolerans TaxID=2731220 RepID=A0A8T8KAB0_9EURY|nr:DUF499 domain-containing protein [Methanobacterium alkalithermotolerans]QUH22361.1 DUF499 domain-containing protein [Methanobacterium alkalithermotolerans]
MTHNLKGILGESLERLGTGKAKPLMIIDTTFGGGKTHTLVALYHLFENSWLLKKNENIKELLKQREMTEIPEVSMVSIDARDLSGIESEYKTIWGEIGRQLNCYDRFEEYDKKMQRPTTKVLTEVLENQNKPVLILLDELVNYLKDSEGIKVGDTNLSNITISFLHNITEAISKTEKAMMVLTLPGFEPAYIKQSELLEGYKESVRSIIAREGSFVVPLRKDDVYTIVKKRLFENIDENLAIAVAEEIQSFYTKNSNYLPEVVKSTEYFKSLEKAYPFHPIIIDILYDRIATISEFNKTRGVLRLLSHVIKRVYQKRNNLDIDLIITPGIIDLLDNSIYNELTNRIDRGEFQNVIRTDIVNEDHKARAQALEPITYMGSNVRIATTIYLYTLIGSTKDYSRGATIKDIALAVSVPKLLYPGDVEESIDKMDSIDGLWYFKQTAGHWYFTVDISIKKLINDAKTRISRIQKKKEIKSRLSKMLRTDIFDVRVWESDVKNPTKPTLVVTDYQYLPSTEGGKPSEGLKDIVEKEGQNFREKQNLIYLLVPKKERISKMEDTVALYLAIKDLKTSTDTKEQLKTYKKKIEEYEKETNSNSNSTIELCYSMIFYPKGNDLKYITLQSGLEGAKNLPEKVYLALKKADKILEDLHPSFIADRVLQEKAISFSDLYERFQNNPSLPLPKNKEILKNSVNNGVDQGLFASYKGSMQDISEINLCKFDTITNDFEYKQPIKGGVKDAYQILPKNLADELFDKLNDIVENTKVCPHCKGRNSKSAVKCTCCGESFDTVEPPEPPRKPGDKEDIECPYCKTKNPKGSEKCEKCGKWIITKKLTFTSIDEFLEDVEEQAFKLQKVEFRLPTTQTLQAARFRLSTLTTGYNPKIKASMQGDKIGLNIKEAEKVDVNELSDIVQRLSNLVQEDVVTTIKFDYDDGIDVSSLIESFKGLKAYEDEIEFKAEIITSEKVGI